LQGDAAVILYDQHDIWRIDPKGRKAPVNLTNDYGRRHHLQLKFAEERPTVLSEHAHLMLSAFDLQTKDNGFFSTTMDSHGDPTLLTMGPYVYDVVKAGTDSDYFSGGYAPIKALHAEAYLVHRESANESGNVVFTTDFKSFTPMSEVHPERGYNWMTSELIEYPLPNGKTGQAALYKP
jgi:hypothetical protein